jgi:hypothetical protein
MSAVGFGYPHDADTFLETLASGLGIDGADLAEAASLLGDNHAAVEDVFANFVTVALTGTADGAGAATIAHGIPASFGLQLAQVWYKGATATDFAACTVASVDATNVVISGAGAGKPVRAYLVYSLIEPTW